MLVQFKGALNRLDTFNQSIALPVQVHNPTPPPPHLWHPKYLDRHFWFPKSNKSEPTSCDQILLLHVMGRPVVEKLLVEPVAGIPPLTLEIFEFDMVIGPEKEDDRVSRATCPPIVTRHHSMETRLEAAVGQELDRVSDVHNGTRALNRRYVLPLLAIGAADLQSPFCVEENRHAARVRVREVAATRVCWQVSLKGIVLHDSSRCRRPIRSVKVFQP